MTLILVVGIVYDNVVLDYAVLDNVKITRQGVSNNIIFSFDVIEAGRVDFNYGQAVLTDRKVVASGQGFHWQWQAQGETEISVRSRKWLFPHWDTEVFSF